MNNKISNKKIYMSEKLTDNITLGLIKELNLFTDENVKGKCRSFVTSILKENIEEIEDEEEYTKNMIDKCKQKYLQTLGYYKNQIKNNIFFEENNVKKISRDLMGELGIKSEEDFVICKTYVAIVMRMVFSEQSQNIVEINEQVLENLNEKTLVECVKLYKKELQEIKN